MHSRMAVASIAVIALAISSFVGVATYRHAGATIFPVTPYEADVNKDGRVNSSDLGNVARQFGQAAPSPTAAASAPTSASRVILTNGCCSGGTPGDAQLVSIPDGALIATFPAAKVITQECASTPNVLGSGGHRVAIVTNVGAALPAVPTLLIVDMTTGVTVASLAISDPGGFGAYAYFPCVMQNGHTVTTDRVIVASDNGSSTTRTATVLNLTTGQTVLSVQVPSQAGYTYWLTCSQDAMFYPVGTTGTNLARLSDGAVIGTFPPADPPQYSAC